MSKLDLTQKVPSGPDRQSWTDIIRSICGAVNPLIGGNVSSKYSPQSSVPSGGSVSYAVSDFIPDSNATVTNGSVRLGWVCTASGTPGTFQEARVLVANFGQLTNSLSVDVALNNTANYFDGPSVAQGSLGVWFAIGTVTLRDTGAGAAFDCKIWDGTNVGGSCRADTQAANGRTTATLCGIFTNPPGNIRISVKDPTAATGQILSNITGNSKDSTISVFRIG